MSEVHKEFKAFTRLISSNFNEDYIESYLEYGYCMEREEEKLFTLFDKALVKFISYKLNISPEKAEEIYRKACDGYIPELKNGEIEFETYPFENSRDIRMFVKVSDLLSIVEEISKQKNKMRSS